MDWYGDIFFFPDSSWNARFVSFIPIACISDILFLCTISYAYALVIHFIIVHSNCFQILQLCIKLLWAFSCKSFGDMFLFLLNIYPGGTCWILDVCVFTFSRDDQVVSQDDRITWRTRQRCMRQPVCIFANTWYFQAL